MTAQQIIDLAKTECGRDTPQIDQLALHWLNTLCRETITDYHNFWFMVSIDDDITFDQGERLLTLPDDFKDDRKLWYLDNAIYTELKSVTMDFAQKTFDEDVTGPPEMYVMMPDNVWIYPLPDITYDGKIEYYSRMYEILPGGVNFLTDNYPDLIRVGLTAMMFKHLQELTDYNTWWKDFMDKLTLLKSKSIERELEGDITLNIRKSRNEGRTYGGLSNL